MENFEKVKVYTEVKSLNIVRRKKCQKHLIYNIAQEGNMEFLQIVCYKTGFEKGRGERGTEYGSSWLVDALEKDFDLVILKPPKRFSSLVWCTDALHWDVQVTNRITNAEATSFRHILFYIFIFL